MSTSLPEKWHFLLLGLNTIYFVLVGFKDKWLPQNQSNNSVKLAWLNSSSRSESEKYNDVSSAKDIIWPLVDFEISFTYIKYKSGAKIDPCITHISLFGFWNILTSYNAYIRKVIIKRIGYFRFFRYLFVVYWECWGKIYFVTLFANCFLEYSLIRA